MKTFKKAVVTKSSVDLARTLGLDPSVAAEWELRYQITERIIDSFKDCNLTITELAKRAETSRARITRILKKDTQSISIDVLSRVLGAMGQRMKVKFLEAA